MRMITPACFGFALVACALALPAVPASAFEVPSVTVAAPSSIVQVYDEDRREYWEHREHEERERRERAEHEARERYERCEHVRHECREHHGYDRHEFHECVERHGCEG